MMRKLEPNVIIVPVLFMLLGSFSSVVFLAYGFSGAYAGVLLRETFDTSSIRNPDIYDTRFSTVGFQNGGLVLYYRPEQNAMPSGIECMIPFTQGQKEPDERIIDAASRFDEKKIDMYRFLIVIERTNDNYSS